MKANVEAAAQTDGCEAASPPRREFRAEPNPKSTKKLHFPTDTNDRSLKAPQQRTSRYKSPSAWKESERMPFIPDSSCQDKAERMTEPGRMRTRRLSEMMRR